MVVPTATKGTERVSQVVPNSRLGVRDGHTRSVQILDCFLLALAIMTDISQLSQNRFLDLNAPKLTGEEERRPGLRSTVS